MKPSWVKDGTTCWQRHWRTWRIQLGFNVFRHASHLGDRWVFHPSFVYDRRPPRAKP